MKVSHTMAVTKPRPAEKRVAPKKPAAPAVAAKKTTPKPVARERRITPAEVAAKVAKTTARKAAPAKVAPVVKTEVRKAPAKTTPKNKVTKDTAVAKAEGKSKPALNTMLSTAMMLDTYGPEILDNMLEALVIPQFAKGVVDKSLCTLVVMDKAVSRKINGTGDKDLDGHWFKLRDGDLAIAQMVPNAAGSESGSVTMFTLDESNAKGCAATFDAKAARALRYMVVPTEDEDKFNIFTTNLLKMLEKQGLVIPWGDDD